MMPLYSVDNNFLASLIASKMIRFWICLFVAVIFATNCSAFTAIGRPRPSTLVSTEPTRIETGRPLLTHNNRDQLNDAFPLAMASSGDSDSWFSQPSLAFALPWIFLLAFAAMAPGEMADPKDAALVQAIIDNPLDPEGVNKLFYFVFNLFAIIPVSLACLIYPQQSKSGGLPATPFFALSAFVGYFALGPYLTFRQVESPPVTRSSLNWFTRNVLENKIFCWSTALFGLFLPFASGVVEPLLSNPGELVQGYVDYWSSSKLGSVSSVDLLFLSITASALIPYDYQLRRPDDDPSVGRTIAALALLLPVIGSALYCAWRPALPEGSDEV